jgi:hypothetical protein
MDYLRLRVAGHQPENLKKLSHHEKLAFIDVL